MRLLVIEYFPYGVLVICSLQVADLEKSLKSQAASKTVSSKSAAAKITSLQKEVAGLEESLKRSSESRDDQLMLIKGLKTHRKGVSEAVKAVHDSFSGLGKATRELRGAAAQELGDFSSFVGNAMTSVVTKLQADSSSLQEVRCSPFAYVSLMQDIS